MIVEWRFDAISDTPQILREQPRNSLTAALLGFVIFIPWVLDRIPLVRTSSKNDGPTGLLRLPCHEYAYIKHSIWRIRAIFLLLHMSKIFKQNKCLLDLINGKNVYHLFWIAKTEMELEHEEKSMELNLQPTSVASA